MFEKEVKERTLVYTTNLFYSIRTMEKELNLIYKSIETFKSTIGMWNILMNYRILI